jgi:8-oxo-dGTP diphosphatase
VTIDMAKLYLIRHAKAGERRLWDGDDLQRPLSPKGWKQSELLAKRLVKLDVGTLHSSPYVRCVQTLEPLAQRLKRSIEIEPRLCEDEPFEPVLELLAEVSEGAVMSSHGDIIPATLAALERRGTQIRTPADWRKASVWVLTRNKHGDIVQATVWPPPVL